MKTRVSLLMIATLLVALFATSTTRADGMVVAGIVDAGLVHTCALTPAGALDCWGAGDFGQADDQPGPFAQVSTSYWHSCALTPSGAVDCWGANWYGEGDDQPGPYTQLSAGIFHNCALTPAGAAECWGKTATESRTTSPGPTPRSRPAMTTRAP